MLVIVKKAAQTMYKVSRSHSANKCNLFNCYNSAVCDCVHSSGGSNAF